MEKAFSAVMDMDRMIGGEFEQGLDALDSATATAAKRAAVTASPTSENGARHERTIAMRYMLLIYRDESVYDKLSAEERGKIFKDATDYSEALRPSGFYLSGEPLESTPTATTVRMKNGKALMTDGPFAETKEQLAGYTIVEAKNLDEALAFAAKHPLVRAGLTIEIRPIWVGPPK